MEDWICKMYTFKVRQKRDNKVKIAMEAKLLERKI